MVKSGNIPRPRDFAPELPASLEATILKALAFHRADRFQTARDLQHELGKFQLEWGQKAGALIDSDSDGLVELDRGDGHDPMFPGPRPGSRRLES